MSRCVENPPRSNAQRPAGDGVETIRLSRGKRRSLRERRTPSSPLLHLSVKSLLFPQVEVSVRQSASVHRLKRAICRQLNQGAHATTRQKIHTSALRLIFRGRFLEDWHTLSDVQISDGHSLHASISTDPQQRVSMSASSSSDDEGDLEAADHDVAFEFDEQTNCNLGKHEQSGNEIDEIERPSSTDHDAGLAPLYAAPNTTHPPAVSGGSSRSAAVLSHSSSLDLEPPTNSITSISMEDLTLNPNEFHEPILVPAIFRSRQYPVRFLRAVHSVNGLVIQENQPLPVERLDDVGEGSSLLGPFFGMLFGFLLGLGSLVVLPLAMIDPRAKAGLLVGVAINVLLNLMRFVSA